MVHLCVSHILTRGTQKQVSQTVVRTWALLTSLNDHMKFQSCAMYDKGKGLGSGCRIVGRQLRASGRAEAVRKVC